MSSAAEAAAAAQAKSQEAPRHIAIIMDGNGRWARARGRPRAFGHTEGVEAFRRTVEAAGELGVRYLTVFGFSTENWRRPLEEVNTLFDLLRLYVGRDLDRLVRENVKVRIIGDRSNLKDDLLEIIERAETRTRENDGLNLIIAFNYGGQSEIARAARAIAEDAAKGKLDPKSVDEKTFASYLDTAGIPDPDFVIRTSGEQRMSNFLLWQAAYSELFFTECLWPDFGDAEIDAALAAFAQRDRRFGGIRPSAVVAEGG